MAPKARPDGTRTLDDRGRITIERDLRRFLQGDRIVQVATPRGILLRPSEEVEYLRSGPDAPNAEDIDTVAVAMEEIDEELREIHGIDPETMQRIPGFRPPPPPQKKQKRGRPED